MPAAPSETFAILRGAAFALAAGLLAAGCGSTVGGASPDGCPAGAASCTEYVGCGATRWPTPSGTPPNGSYAYQSLTLSVNGTSRQLVVSLPAGYSSAKAYPVVFAWHGLGGTAEQLAQGGRWQGVYNGYYGLQYLSAQAGVPIIFVAGQGLPSSAGGTDYGWPNTSGRDVAFTRSALDWLRANYCVDGRRVFSVGMSYGGIMSNTVGCAMGDVFRAIAPMSGAGPGWAGGLGGNPACAGQVAAWLAHGDADPTVALAQGVASRDFWLAKNHCTSTAVATTPSPCVAYQGCDSGYPVVWCEFSGVHEIQAFEPQGIWAFLQPFLR